MQVSGFRAATKFYKTNICRAGGTFALYSLLCRHAKIKTIPNQHRTDEELTTYSRSTFHERSFAAKTKRWLEERESWKSVILILVLAGTCMVIGDGILTPAISGIYAFCLNLISFHFLLFLSIIFYATPLFQEIHNRIFHCSFISCWWHQGKSAQDEQWYGSTPVAKQLFLSLFFYY
jgi:hypothetical protein